MPEGIYTIKFIKLLSTEIRDVTVTYNIDSKSRVDNDEHFCF